MEQLMRENTGQLARSRGKFQIQHHAAFADESSRVDRLPEIALGVKFPAACAQGREEPYADSSTIQLRQPLPKRLNGPFVVGAAA